MLKTHSIFGDPKQILLDLSGQHHLPALLPLATRLLASSNAIVLTRIWLMRAPLEDDCANCLMAAECDSRERCLHLVASYGNSAKDSSKHWEGLDGQFRRFPVGVRKVGHIAKTGLPLQVDDMSAEKEWIVCPDWIREQAIKAMVGLPLIYRGETLGVLAVFSREPVEDSCREWIGMIADHLSAAIANASAIERIETLKMQLEMENEYLREEVESASFGELVGGSPALGTLARQIDLVAPTESSVLILGESGTGKELVAREVHRRSSRTNRPLIKVNCAAIPRELYESEFFGHTKGAFTGALRDRTGRFELANGGTLFLDEIGEIPLDLQSKLLRVLQEGELERVGEDRTRQVDVRLIAATNRDLRSEAIQGRFRQDLYYRLSVFPIEIPPLRERLEDIPLLAEHFLARYARQLGRKRLRLTLANLRQLQNYDWPGNIRELQHVIEKAVIVAVDGRLRFDIPTRSDKQIVSKAAADTLDSEDTEPIYTIAELREIEIANIRRALAAANGKIYGKDGAADRLAMKPTTLASRIKSLGISK
ncbi:Formate hydrogenlyase transcriptional activator [Polystyrenella longa]|uniref:Formate hydrogenlyase transcriptional activator n=1 Tax=Polystyrenella longa TaxID=2528007 RepID=A0A518CTP8_9PLAN|nr:sigma 54-interacting transcriptional regulator [Polystyrenella longa]QDU82599.1 Formate hydrogenlyase transcriptional activator [Polystyrenella longa]